MAVKPIIQEVEGVLHFNNVTRDEMLKRNLGKYSQWKETLHPAIGEYYDIDYDRQLKDSTDGKGLFVYTHDGKSDYSKDIERKYFQFGEGPGENYSYRPLTYGELNPWTSFQHGTYTQYLDEVFGKDMVMRHVDYINNLLSGQFIENALRQTETGVIEDINVAAALQGVITTNPNNMSGKDTMLGTIGNRMYAQTLYNGAIFNSDRIKAEIRDGENYYTKAYLTPYLVNQYGNNLANVMELSDIMKIGTNETHIREDLGKDVHILDRYDGNVADSPQFRILNEQIKNAIELRGVDEHTLHSQIIKKRDGSTIVMDKKGNDLLLPINVYTPVNGQGYINASREKNQWRYNISWNDVDNFGIEDRSDDIANNQTGERIISGIDNPISGRFSGPYFYNEYNEKEKESIPDMQENFREPDEFNFYKDIPEDKNTLLAKTSRLFHENQLDTLIARFHTDESKYGFPEFTDTARSQFGNSHGRNLLRLDAVNNPKNDTNGYDNPYCRTWTYHHQYNQIKKLIRPFIKDDKDEPEDISTIQAINKKYRAYRTDNNKNVISGIDSLKAHSVLQDNGIVRITPHKGEKEGVIEKGIKDEKEGVIEKGIKDCMFSIENLAWKDVLSIDDNISKEQIGPNGGRIMWFPPYNLDFQEGVNVEWNQNSFIGRGEKVYTYTNTERTGTLSFSLLIDHPAVINSMAADSYEGMGDEKDPEADILRFFAGCNLPKIPDIPVTGGTIPTKPPKTPPQVKTGDIKFKVYFPNNFSGLVNQNPDSTEVLTYDSFNCFVQPELEDDHYSTTTDGFENQYGDDYWWQYLLVGNNTCVPADPELFRGYEMSKNGNTGLFDDRNIFTKIGLPPCRYKQNIICNNGRKEINTDIIATTVSRTGELYNIELQYACKNNLDKKNDAKKVYYQVDYDLRQILQNDSLTDNNSHGLNATFAYNESQGKERGENEYTFAEVVLAMLKSSTENKYKKLYEAYKDYLVNTCGVDNSQVEKLATIFSNTNTKYTGIDFHGSADTNDQPNATMLGLRRSIVTKQMITRILNGAKDIEDKHVKGEEINTKAPQKPTSDISMKKDRYCDVVLHYETAESDKLSDTANNRGAANVSGSTSGNTGIQQIEQNRKDTEENKAAKKQENAENKAIVANATINKKQGNMRYETEAEYFTKLKVTDPLLFKNLKDKFKYFNPAYHSISPEGFNARLTFLHQCTRQGQTHEMNKQKNSGNGYVQTASNLAFGRMPVCVIRIGDFIHTRAIINSLTINYASSNGIIWDLNQEGAGVQPMYANISLGITLLGGQSLGAPISRLQNAISFNYYANAEVYDNRADVAEYEKKDGESTVSYKRIWTPSNDKYLQETSVISEMFPEQNTTNKTENKEENKNKQDGTYKDPTDEQIAEKFSQEMVFSQEMTDYINNNQKVISVKNEYFDPSDFLIYIYCNELYQQFGYDKYYYKTYSEQHNALVKKGKDVSEAIDVLTETIDSCIDEFVYSGERFGKK